MPMLASMHACIQDALLVEICTSRDQRPGGCVQYVSNKIIRAVAGPPLAAVLVLVSRPIQNEEIQYFKKLTKW
jgi:hypothetical protein